MSDLDKPQTPHVYGQPDSEDKQAPAYGGMRGEGSAPLDPDATSPDQKHEVEIDGRAVEIQETSGTAFAEAAGRAGLARETRDGG